MGLVPQRYSRAGMTGRSTAPAGPPQPYANTPYAGQFQSAVDFFSGYTSPELAALQNQAAGYQAQLGQGGGGSGASRAAAQRQYELGLAQIDLQREGLGIDRGAANRQLGYYGNLTDIDQRRMGADMERLGREFGFAGENLANITHLIGQRRGFAGENYGNLLSQYGIDQESLDAQSARELELAQSAAVANGAMTSEGFHSDRNFIAGELDRGTRGIGLQKDAAGTDYRSQLAELEGQEKGAKLDYRQRVSDLDNETRNRLLDFETSQLGYQEQTARLGDRLQQLDITARQYDLSAEQLAANLEAGLAAMGAGDSLRVGQLMDAMNSNNIEQAALARHVVDQALIYAPYFPAPTTTAPRSGGYTRANSPSSWSNPSRRGSSGTARTGPGGGGGGGL